MIRRYINFTELFIGFAFGILLNNFFEEKFPNEFKILKNLLINTSVNISYNIIYCYSKLQIFFIKAKNKLNLFIESNPILLKIRNDFNNSNLNSNEPEKNIEYCDGYDFYIYNHIDNHIINKQIFYKDSNQPMNQLSDIKFMLIEFKIGENVYKIDLKTDKFNYYLLGNKFTKGFFIFYIETHLNKKHDTSNNNCSLKIIDHNVNQLEIEFTYKNESILLEQNGYKLIITNDSDNK
jgi:hypothetical protein